jgi:hypothetical protein
MNDILVALLAFNILSQVLDFYTTHRIVKEGKGYEANPAVRWFIDQLGLTVGLAVPKAIGIALSVWLYSIGGTIYLAVLAAIFIYVLANNFKVLNK